MNDPIARDKVLHVKAAWEDAERLDPELRKLLKRYMWSEQEITARLRDRRDQRK